MRRREFILGSLTAPWWTGASAQPAARLYRVGVLSRSIPRESFVRIPAALRALGYQEGRNIAFEFRYAEGRAERLPALARELVDLNVDLIVAIANDEVLAAKQATTRIPIVMQFSQVPVELGLVASLARPGGNVTGTTVQPPETAGKMFEVLREAVPGARSVAVLWEEGFPGMNLYREAGARAIEKLGMQWTLYAVREAADIDTAFAGLRRRRPDALYVVLTGQLTVHRKRIIEFAARERLPALYTSELAPLEGGLIAYSADFGELSDRTATYVDRILRGADPGELAIEQPARYILRVNLRTARDLGLTIPQSLLLRADRVIE